ncbi:hypothetical protein [Bosea sp. (in: a-proteobacteria)]|uniref:hypothetical protein n=1 Tax=Bosea sp. (in: a-proteobacteria) TaxID=1871050 RepID=UPI002608E54D|nr:hypothetical protein [Bosea sp. (in: a-proteobacteria)]MCO5089937.1 hypothetical protein [Bosea sp. (in: a-proteobacteria)]
MSDGPAVIEPGRVESMRNASSDTHKLRRLRRARKRKALSIVVGIALLGVVGGFMCDFGGHADTWIDKCKELTTSLMVSHLAN